VEQLSLVVCRLVCLTGGFRSFILHNGTRSKALITLTTTKFVVNEGFNHVLWLKQVPLKINIFI
jgi:hypothetical protein